MCLDAYIFAVNVSSLIHSRQTTNKKNSIRVGSLPSRDFGILDVQEAGKGNIFLAGDLIWSRLGRNC